MSAANWMIISGEADLGTRCDHFIILIGGINTIEWKHPNVTNGVLHSFMICPDDEGDPGTGVECWSLIERI